MSDFGGTPDIPDPPPPAAELPMVDPEELAKRRAASQKRNVSRDSLVINPGTATRLTSPSQTGTGIRIG